MEFRAKEIVFRRLTYADFRHINKEGGEETGGGGQSYIDFPTKDVTLAEWIQFLGTKTSTGAGNRPVWNFEINSLGLDQPKDLKIYQRRPASVSIASQKIHSRSSNRLPSWHPDNGFPEDYDDTKENLIVYIIKTFKDEYWAGWFLQDHSPATWIEQTELKKMFTSDSAGHLTFYTTKLFFDSTISTWPFKVTASSIINQIPDEEEINKKLELEDTSQNLDDIIAKNSNREFIKRVQKIRKRNLKLVRNLKQLYQGKCQISGTDYTFIKKDGTYYCEVHHLISLGENGSDSYSNAIVISPLIHRMLHYAEVEEIDLSKIKDGKLDISINKKKYTITWHPEHLKTVEAAVND